VAIQAITNLSPHILRTAPTSLPTYVLRPWEIMRLNWRSVSVSKLQVTEASRQD